VCNNFSLIGCATYGFPGESTGLEVLKWLHSTFILTKEDLIIEDEETLKSIFRNKEIASWLETTFDMNDFDRLKD
jgi:esterase/lipase superfamily enzyme